MILKLRIEEKLMIRISSGLFLVALTTLMLELVLTRAFDVILAPNLAYMVISSAMFSFGLSGIYATIRPLPKGADVRAYVTKVAFLFALFSLAILPILNALPFDYEQITDAPFAQMASFGAMYLALVVPFFLAGLIFTTVFSAFSKDIQNLYFWDLTGAAVGCVILVPFLPIIGPGGLLFVTCALGLLASGLFSRSGRWATLTLIAGVVLVFIPLAKSPEYFDFREHLDKRGVREARVSGKVEVTVWDPISKIDVIDMTVLDPKTGQVRQHSNKKHIAYDGGSQSSTIFPFAGSFDGLRERISHDENAVKENFWQRGVLASHYLKRDTGQSVLVIGSAGGQETKAALVYGASHVDAIEMVRAVVELGKTRYAHYNGSIFNHPHVLVRVGEGRSFLQSSSNQYDVIQIFSNHTSSSIAAGTGAMAATYLLTSEAFQQYFRHLKKDGILHINHHIYPRMITTAALAWKKSGRTNFRGHVMVFQREGLDTLPTFMIKMSPWTAIDLSELSAFFEKAGSGERHFTLSENPIHPEESFLSDAFYSGDLPKEISRQMPYRIEAVTDDKPYFKFLRKSIRPIDANPRVYVDEATALYLNSQLKKNIVPMDVIHLFVTGAVSLLFAFVCIFAPMYFSKVGSSRGTTKYHSMLYFSCLGAGFIILELIYIQIFMRLIGFPLYTYSTVIFTMLLGAGLGSAVSKRLGISVTERWAWPFIGVLALGLLLMMSQSLIFDMFLEQSPAIRILASAIMIFPVAFFLGMPFPLGILAIQDQPAGAIAWAWGLNGLFTVIGGLLCVVISIFWGFQTTVLVALGLYAVAFVTFSRLRPVGLKERTERSGFPASAY